MPYDSPYPPGTGLSDEEKEYIVACGLGALRGVKGDGPIAGCIEGMALNYAQNVILSHW